MIDPMTKEDALWNLVEFFTQDPSFYRVSALTNNSTLDASSIAEYLGYQFSRNNSLERVFKIAGRLDHTDQAVSFTDAILG